MARPKKYTVSLTDDELKKLKAIIFPRTLSPSSEILATLVLLPSNGAMFSVMALFFERVSGRSGACGRYRPGGK